MIWSYISHILPEHRFWINLSFKNLWRQQIFRLPIFFNKWRHKVLWHIFKYFQKFQRINSSCFINLHQCIFTIIIDFLQMIPCRHQGYKLINIKLTIPIYIDLCHERDNIINLYLRSQLFKSGIQFLNTKHTAAINISLYEQLSQILYLLILI